MRRGTIATAALAGDFGKPRPALIIQAEAFEAHTSVTVLPLTSEIIDAPSWRITLEPSRGNGLLRTSQIMIDKAVTVPSGKIGRVIGEAGDDCMLRVSRALAVWLGIA